MRRLAWIAMLGCLYGAHASGYQEPTHQSFALAAITQSDVAVDPGLLKALGLQGYSDSENKYQNSDGAMQTIPAIVSFGAEHEDSTSPQVRPKNHFFDPQHNGVGLLYGFGTPSPSWILEGEGQEHEFSYRKARKDLAAALSSSLQVVRDQHWGQVFQSLGHVIHHIQDMAQPQHVRDDLHIDKDQADKGIQQAFASLVHDPSYYERYTQSDTARVTWEPLALQAIPAVVHSRAREYWTNSADTGMADFTSRNFVSKGTNFGLNGGSVVTDKSYPLPLPQKPIPASRVRLDDPELGLANGVELCEALKQQREAGKVKVPPGVDCEIEFVASAIASPWPGEAATNPRASSLSLFDAEFLRYGKRYTYASQYSNGEESLDRSFTLNHFNFETAYRYLIPRAVAHSAGLINHFFRGRMEMVDAGLDGEQTRIRVRNTSVSGNDFGPGTFRLFYESYDGSRKPLPIETGGDLKSGQFGIGKTHELTFVAPEDIDLIRDDPYVLVYEGNIGVESAVAGLVFDAPGGLGGFVYDAQRLTLVSNGQSLRSEELGNGLLYRRNGFWKRRPLGGYIRIGQIDWKGWYVDGRPTRNLSWDHGGLGIFSGGKLFATAPCPILSAALQKNGDGVPWLVTVCGRNSKDVVLRRPAVRNAEATGWAQLAEFENPPNLKDAQQTAWRFNGEGTEAQGLRALKPMSGQPPSGLNQYARLKINVTGSDASLSDVGNTQIVRQVNIDHDYDCPAGTVTTSDVTTTGGETIIAVDYIDQQEVFATLKASEARSRFETGTLGDSYIATLAIGEQVHSQWTLHVDGEDYEWITESVDYQADKADNGDIQVRSSVTSKHGHIASMDLRSGLLVIEHNDYELLATDDYPGSGSGNTVREEIGTRALRIHGPVAKSITDLDKTARHSEQSRMALDVFGEISTRTQVCLEGDAAEQQDRVEKFVEAQAPLLYSGRWSTPAWGSKASVSHAVDLAGNLFLSAFIYEGPSATGNVGYTYYNELSDGDAMAIAFPNMGGKAHFKIGLQ